MNEEKQQKLIELSSSGMTNYEMARVLEVKHATLLSWKRKLRNQGIVFAPVFGRPTYENKIRYVLRGDINDENVAYERERIKRMENATVLLDSAVVGDDVLLEKLTNKESMVLYSRFLKKGIKFRKTKNELGYLFTRIV